LVQAGHFSWLFLVFTRPEEKNEKFTFKENFHKKTVKKVKNFKKRQTGHKHQTSPSTKKTVVETFCCVVNMFYCMCFVMHYRGDAIQRKKNLTLPQKVE
jgi:hypothetical protein